MPILLERHQKGHSEVHSNCTLCHREKAKIQHYPLQMTEIPIRSFDNIAIDLVTECEPSISGNKHILMIIDHLIRWIKAYPIPDKTADTIVSTFINKYLPIHMSPRYILSVNGSKFKNDLMDKVLKQLGIDRIFLAPTTCKAMGNWKFSTSI